VYCNVACCWTCSLLSGRLFVRIDSVDLLKKFVEMESDDEHNSRTTFLVYMRARKMMGLYVIVTLMVPLYPVFELVEKFCVGTTCSAVDKRYL